MSNATLVIRPAEEYDVPEVLRIERASFADPWSADSFLTSLELDRMRFLVAEERREGDANQAGDGMLLGYVIALVLAEEAEVADIAVSSDARRRGVGGLLLDAVTDELARRGVRSVYLEVRESNTAARALYESRAFRQVGRRRGYYQHPAEDALLLKREIEPG
ncbi:MAG: ribosomal-protein-alanine acetyltransferase [Gemmatimonadetes bacterium]|nr:ribosomal-protein-alanine acetyltransferase [Gemmatimonadota bacterium]